MAAIAIPIVVLGSLYILSEQEKKKENYQEQLEEEDEKKEFFTSKKTEGYSNYETSKLNNFEKPINNTINSYNNSNQHTDKFFVAPKVKDDNQITLMNGQVVNPNTFKHNNMQPYFGAKIRGSTSDYNNMGVSHLVKANKPHYLNQTKIQIRHTELLIIQVLYNLE